MITFDEDKQDRRYKDLLKKEEEDLVKILASKFNLEYIDLAGIPVTTDALRIIPEADSRTALAAAFAVIDRRLKIAAREPENEKLIEILGTLKKKGYDPELYMASTASLEKAWKAYKDLSFAFETKAGSLDIANEEIAKIVDEHQTLEQIKETLTTMLANRASYHVSRILEIILAGALATNASDIHLEPEQEYVRLRYRLDGILTDVLNFDTQTYTLILSRIKLISGLKLNIKKDSQDGRFSVKLASNDIEIRTSILPGAYNESIVLRILNPKSIDVPMEALGIPKKLLSIIMDQIRKPNGMILTTGPTGSGKTTTLYAFLKKVHDPQIKIITIEDPIEYHLAGIVQTQTNDKGYTFLEGLRSALRQDPDIIMVGEIRDSETAQIAINSALTGHLVFSTLHTNSAAGAFPRLIDLGVNSKIIASALSISLAQRLVRQLCPHCKKEVPLEGNHLEKITSIVQEITDPAEKPSKVSSMWLPVGCEHCNGTGYKSRIGIYEGILITPEITSVVDMNGSELEIQAAAKSQGILTMKQDGVLKVLSGITSFEELTRVIEI